MSVYKILVGRFGAPQGVKGEIRIKTFTADPQSVGNYKILSDDEGRVHEILRTRALRDDLIVASVKGVDDRDQAKNLTGRALYVERAKLPPPDEDEYYVCDLIGLEAISPQDEVLGRITNVLNFGAGDILEIKPPAAEAILIAFTRENAPRIDFDAGRIILIRPLEQDAEGE